MTNEEAHGYMEDLQRILTQYRFIFSREIAEANGKAIEALEKQIPKKIANRNEIYVDGRIIVTLGRCPLCKCEVSDKHTFCYICGQHLDWSDER